MPTYKGLNLRLVPEIHAGLKRLAVRDQRTLSNYILHVLTEHLIEKGIIQPAPPQETP